MNRVEAKDVNSLRLSSNDLNVWHTACVGTLSSRSVCTTNLSSDLVNSNAVCANRLNVPGSACLSDVLAETACVQELRANTGCVGTLSVNNLLNCGVYRATAVYSADTLYTLDNDLDFDLILDDPNGNLFTGPTRYIAPVSGYYVVTLEIDEHALAPNAVFGPVLGVPVSNPEILVNGDVFRQNFTSYLTFLNRQQSTLTSLIHLFAGDIVTLKFDVLAGQDVLGFIKIPGTVVVEGNGTTENHSLFQIHLLSVDCNEGPVCPPCPTGPAGFTGCAQCPTVCTPCQSHEVVVCTPREPEHCSFKPCPSPMLQTVP